MAGIWSAMDRNPREPTCMTSTTYLPGKDAPLEKTIASATARLNTIGLAVTPVSWLNPAPHCWSVHLQAERAPHIYTNGKGSSRQAALASALGEFMERLSTSFFFSDYFLDEPAHPLPYIFYPDEQWFPVGSDFLLPTRNSNGYTLLNEELRTLYNPESELSPEMLLDNNTHAEERGICALPFENVVDRSVVFFPVSLLNNLYLSNGMAAGNSATECSSQALSEIIERYVKNIIIREGHSLPDVPASHLRRFPKLQAILDTLHQHQFTVKIKDGSLGGRFPVICALLADYKNGGVYAAFGANCRFEVAVERTLTELLQGRQLDALKHFRPPCHDVHEVADPFNLESHFIDSDGLLAWRMFRDKPDFTFCPWDFQGSTMDEYQHLLGLITAGGFKAYRAEYSHYGMYSCRFLVPGMSEVYPIDDLLFNNRASGAELRPHLLRLPNMSTAERGEFLHLIEEHGFHDQQLISQLTGIIFDKESGWDTLSVGELKALLFLAMGKKTLAMEWCDWCIEHGRLEERRLRFFRLLHTLLSFSLSGESLELYRTNIRLFFSETELEYAGAVIDAQEIFPGLHFGDAWSDISASHRNLLTIYREQHRYKSSQST